MSAFICYHTTTKDRVESILKNGLVPGSQPNWFEGDPVPYIMLSLTPIFDLHTAENYIFEVIDPKIKKQHFENDEGLRWPHVISPGHLRAFFYSGKYRERNYLESLRTRIENQYLDHPTGCGGSFGEILCWELHYNNLAFTSLAEKWGISVTAVGELIYDHCKRLEELLVVNHDYVRG